MGKQLFTVFFLIALVSHGQTSEEKIVEMADIACVELEDVSASLERSERYEAIRQVLVGVIISDQVKNGLVKDTSKMLDSLKATNTLKDKDTINLSGTKNVIVVDQNLDEIEGYLLRNCEAMRLLMVNDEESSEVSVSDKKVAIEIYNDGLKSFEVGDFESAVKYFKKATRKDRTFAFAWDMLGFSYRKMDKFKEAIKAYDKSIKLDPKGRMPLMNKPIAYAKLDEIDKAIDSYKDFITVFPEDPEGFYGIARMHYFQNDYEKAVDSMMKAYLLYTEIKSPYARDAEANLAAYYAEMKEKDLLETWNAIAKRYKIQIQD